jgi:ubiquinone/menaquinone biosynthesis C-methylase UbiE
MTKEPQSSDKAIHIKLQKQCFDGRVDLFNQPIPEDIDERTRKIVKSANLKRSDCVLDVGTGVGVLVGHFLEEGLQAENIVGCDLSDAMLGSARERYPGVFFWQGDIAKLERPFPPHFPDHIEFFDSVFFNACFGNMWDQEEALGAALNLLGREGQIVISHPLGAGFVDYLHRQEPEIVPHRLPSSDTLDSFCKKFTLTLSRFEDREDLYLAILNRGIRST